MWMKYQLFYNVIKTLGMALNNRVFLLWDKLEIETRSWHEDV